MGLSPPARGHQPAAEHKKALHREVSGRGELHLTILLENMRREGYELAVSKPRVVLRDIDGERCEPIELVTADIEEGHQGGVMTETFLKSTAISDAGLTHQTLFEVGRGSMTEIVSGEIKEGSEVIVGQQTTTSAGAKPAGAPGPRLF